MRRSSDKANPEAVNAFAHEVKNAGKASPEGQGNWAKSTFDDLVQYNDGFRSNLIGTPHQIAERILALKDAGASLILLGFLHFQEEVEYFGKHVIPLVRELEERRSAARCGRLRTATSARQPSPGANTAMGDRILSRIGGSISRPSPGPSPAPPSRARPATCRWQGWSRVALALEDVSLASAG